METAERRLDLVHDLDAIPDLAERHAGLQQDEAGADLLDEGPRRGKGSRRRSPRALRHKKVVQAHIEKLASEMGAAEPHVLAHQLALLIDGAIVAAMVSRNPGVADTAGLAAGPLLTPYKAKKPRPRSTVELVAV